MERLITAVGAVRPSSGPSGPSGVMGRALALTIVAGRTVTPLSHFVFFRDGRRRRPSLFDLRVVHEVIVPGSRQPPAPAVAAYSPNAIKPAKTGAHAGA